MSKERLGLGSSTSGMPSLADCFQLFTKEETLDDDEKPVSGSDGVKGQSSMVAGEEIVGCT